MEYSPEVEEARATLISEFNWTITGDSEGTCTIGLGINPVDNTTLTVYPNPAQNEIHVLSESAPEDISVFNVQGQLVKTFKSDESTLDVRELTEGVYFFRIKTKEGNVQTKKVVIQK